MKTFIYVVLSLLFLSPCYAQEEGLKTVKVTEKLVVVSGGGGNIAFLIGDKEILAVDSGYSPDIARQAIGRIREISPLPITRLIFTHYHQDHINGASAFPETTQIIASAQTAKNITELNIPRLREQLEKVIPEQRAALQKKIAEQSAANSPDVEKSRQELAELEEVNQALQQITFRIPGVTFEKEMSLTFDGQELYLLQPGRNHTNGDVIVYFKTEKAVHMGDILFHLHMPYIDWKAGSDTAHWIETLQSAGKWDIASVIPGHGEITDKEGLSRMAAYLRDLREAVSGAIAKGQSLEEMIKTITMPAYENYKFRNFLSSGIGAVYHELTGR